MPKLISIGILLLASFLMLGFVAPGQETKASLLVYPGEKHLKNVRQLTFGG